MLNRQYIEMSIKEALSICGIVSTVSNQLLGHGYS